MDWWVILVTAVVLAMDAFAVSIASGIAIQRLHLRHALTIALWFGAFQAIMPILGALGGLELRDTVAAFAKELACAVLCVVGIKMMVEAIRLKTVETQRDPLNVAVLFGLSLATSLDALAAGFGFAMVLDSTRIVLAAATIGVVTFVMSFVGVWIGDHGHHVFESKIEFLGGLLLVGLGIKILLGA
jgi:putative Mn2+ efflux pump MntP